LSLGRVNIINQEKMCIAGTGVSEVTIVEGIYLNKSNGIFL
jgi:hypothetical protein